MLYKDREWLLNQHINLGKSHRAIAKEFGYGVNTIHRWIKKHNIVNTVPPQYRRKNSNPPVKIECKVCGKEREVKYAKYKNGHGRYCGESCAATDRYYGGTGEKLQNGHKKFFSSAEGKELRSKNGVKTALLFKGNHKRTNIEILMAEELSRRGIEYEEQKNLGNKFLLDFFLPGYGIVVECDGDYWHNLPESKRRDKRKNAYVKACGYSMYRFWEHEINASVESCVDIVLSEINGKESIS